MIFDNLESEIRGLIQLGAEGDYWDFKQEWHVKKTDLLHDIICMANNQVGRDGYIIIGVTDNYVVQGVPPENRKNQQGLIDFLRDKPFAGEVRPSVYVRTLKIDEKDVDVIIVKSTSDVPYYLSKCYKDDGLVDKDNIYTRIGDTNTPINESANIDKIEKLWRRRFGIDKTSLEKVKLLLSNPLGWLPVGTDGIHSSNTNYQTWYNKDYPEFKIRYDKDISRFDEGRIDVVEQDMYWMNKLPMPTHNAFVYELSVLYHSTVMYSTLAVFADNHRFRRVLWKHNYLHDNLEEQILIYCYVEKGSLDFSVDEWLCNHYDTVEKTLSATYHPSLEPWGTNLEYIGSDPYSVVPVFESADEHKAFIEYIESNISVFKDTVGDWSRSDTSSAECVDPNKIEWLCKVGETLVNWLKTWRRMKLQE
jgi:hypothetical protein